MKKEIFHRDITKIIKNFVIVLTIVAIAVFIDISSKRWVFSYLTKINNLHVLNDNNSSLEITKFFSLVMVENRGISFGMFNDFKYSASFFMILQFIIGAIIFILGTADQSKCRLFAFSLIAGGAFGNAIDRLQMGRVADFLDFHIADYHWPAFNFADSIIFIGVSILIIYDIVNNKNHHKN